MEILEEGKSFPKEETYSLTDQVCRSSRSVCTNIAEAFRKRQYRVQFLSKVSDADMENSETLVWLEFTLACKYINQDKYDMLLKENEEIGKLLFHMLNNPDKYWLYF
jgi:four helix bundle protein